MLHRYLPMTEEDKQQMLQTIGVQSIDELFSDIPESVRFQGEYNIKPAKSEPELMKELMELAAKNADMKTYTSFLGAGVYDHYIPTIVDHVISRSEFYTAYTPYQPEISQGELQAIFEFQTMICELTGMDVANSSMYDGGTSLAEAALLSAARTKKKKVLLSNAVHPEYRDVVKTYAKGPGLEVVEIPYKNGVKEMATMNIQKAHYAKEAFVNNGLHVVFTGPFFNELVVRMNKPVAEINKKLLEKRIIGGYDLGRDYPELQNCMLIAVTELRTKEEIDTLVKELGDCHA